MLLAYVTAFLGGLIMGFIRGFQWLKFSTKSLVATAFVLSVPFIYTMINGGNSAIPFVVVIGISITYLSLIIGALVGGLIGKFFGRRAF